MMCEYFIYEAKTKLGGTVLEFKSNGVDNAIRVKGGGEEQSKIIGVFSNGAVALSCRPEKIRCFVDKGVFTLGEVQVYLSEEALALVYAFLSTQFKNRGIYWGC